MKTIVIDKQFQGYKSFSTFPHPTYYPYQYEALVETYNLLKEYDTVLLEAPPGLGKSAIAYAISEKMKPYYLSCNRIGLLEQYTDTFKKHGLIQAKGRLTLIVL